MKVLDELKCRKLAASNIQRNQCIDCHDLFCSRKHPASGKCSSPDESKIGQAESILESHPGMCL
ncbi:AAEL006072-PA [Aedes aegypti]|uniref:AAEL006072-PA n=1 Tax=Aedes aegypti TaxID=7159 RepID=Q177N5_AEDAE|nr:AAEL006072-PA [Aedes aegypti]